MNTIDFPFDKVYLLRLCEDTTRINRQNENFKNYNILDKINIWYTCKREITNKIARYVPGLASIQIYNFKDRETGTVLGSAFNCALEHYTIIKTSYLRGFNNILILEDDTLFTKSIDDINLVFNNLPNNYDFISFINIYDFEESNDMFTNINNIGTWSFGCYALSRNGMKAYIDYMDKNFCNADNSDFYKTSNINSYCINKKYLFANSHTDSKSNICNP